MNDAGNLVIDTDGYLNDAGKMNGEVNTKIDIYEVQSKS